MNFFMHYRKHILILVSIVLLVTAFFTYEKKSSFTFVDNALTFIVTPVQDGISKISSFFTNKINERKLNKENELETEDLVLKVKELESENEALSKKISLLSEENDELSSLLNIAKKYPDFETIGVRITAKDPGNWYDSFLINRGSNDGIYSNMPIIDSSGLVGMITEAGKTHSKAQSILDSHNSVSAVCLRTNDTGIISGDYTLFEKGLCRMSYISPTSSIVPGDEIFTSYLSDIYPAGISIGIVTEIGLEESGLSKTAVISPTANLKQMDSLLVITNYKKQTSETSTED
ncbi:MAG: rod shape-determining protein MreC [Lachnospiraceae bacterium]|nr:rod shape-determining protein MreC [Lachnospiraceae bacterium]